MHLGGSILKYRRRRIMKMNLTKADIKFKTKLVGFVEGKLSISLGCCRLHDK